MRQRLNGFVAFVKRADAAQAKDEMNETELNGFVMRIGWGKASSYTHAQRISTGLRLVEMMLGSFTSNCTHY